MNTTWAVCDMGRSTLVSIYVPDSTIRPWVLPTMHDDDVVSLVVTGEFGLSDIVVTIVGTRHDIAQFLRDSLVALNLNKPQQPQ